MKKFICMLLTLVLMLGTLTVLAEEDAVIVTVNGDDIYQSELDDMVDSISSRMSQYGIDGTDETVLEVIKEAALKELVDDRLLTQDMTALGFYDMTEDEESAISAAATASMENLLSQYESYFQEYLDGQDDESDLSASDLAQTYMSSLGYTQETMENYYRNALASEKYEDWLMEGEPEVTDEDVQTAYEERVAESKEAYSEDVEAFETALASGSETWYRPAGYRAILQIMIAAEGDDDEAKLASVKEKTDDIYARLENGESFESLIEEYGEDTAFSVDGFMETGYQVHQDSILWEDAFIEAAFGEDMQQPGDYSQPVVFEDNVHILYYLKDVPEGAVELTDELASALSEDLYSERAEAKMEERLEELKASGEVIYAETAETEE